MGDRRWPMFLVGVLVVTSAPALAQTSNEGNNLVSFTIASSIGLTFEDAVAGVVLAGAGTNAATMAFGNVSAYGTISTTGVTRTVGASDFTVSSPFGAQVKKANSTSASYTLAVALASADATNTWKVNAVTLTTSNQNLGTAYSYASTVVHTLYLTVPLTAASSAVSKVLNFTATAN